ncbi:MAG: FlgD immunoglobulin-like domain containing protein, partial [Candidatus Latescibacterota bacterium]|nr:FlgD immunoglobulin-like domain containing protein [Candidatus Latescibacterota bacterium]
NVLPVNLTENPDVRIDPVPVGVGPPGVTTSHGAYEITSDPVMTLRKHATLEFQIPQDSTLDLLAVYQLSGATWTRLGGTVAGDRFRVPVTDLSIYGLFEDASISTGSASITNIDFSNRAFSPTGVRRQGGVAPLVASGSIPLLLRTTDISFDLSATANVRIEIYNRSGQLQIILVSGQQMNAGRNVVTWDGLDHENQPARSGLYIVSIEAGGERQQKTVAVVNR